MQIIHKLTGWMLKGITSLSVALVSLLTVLTMSGVIYRYVLKSPIVWLYETTVLVFAWTVFSGVVLAYSKQEHIHLTFVMNSLKEEKQKWLHLIIDVVNFIFLAMVVYYGFKIVQSTRFQSYNTINVSLGWFYASFPVMGIPMLLILIDRNLQRFLPSHKGNS